MIEPAGRMPLIGRRPIRPGLAQRGGRERTGQSYAPEAAGLGGFHPAHRVFHHQTIRRRQPAMNHSESQSTPSMSKMIPRNMQAAYQTAALARRKRFRQRVALV